MTARNGELGVMVIDTAVFLVDYLVRSGLRRVHVVPDPETAPLINAFRLRGIEIVTIADPTAAALLAGAEGAIRQGVGVVLGGAGRSAALMAPAIAQAQADHHALIAVTIEQNGHRPSSTAGRQLDLRTVFASLGKGSYRLTAANAQELIPLVWRLSTSAPRGAVHVRLHAEELDRDAPAAPAQAISPSSPTNGSRQALIDEAREMIARARRLTLLIGSDAVVDRADVAVRLLAEGWNAAVLVTPMAKGTISERHPLFAGVLGALGDRAAIDLIQQSDLVIRLGVTSGDLIHPWPTTVPSISLSRNGGEPEIPATIALHGPLNALANMIAGQPVEPRDGDTVAANVRRSARDAIFPEGGESEWVTPQKVIDHLRELVTPDVPLAVESDAVGLLAAQLWSVDESETFLISTGLGLPGSGLALAATAASNEIAKQVVWMGSDQALTAHPELLAHLRSRPALPTLIVINHGTRIDLRTAQAAAGYPPFGSRYAPPNLEALAAAFGYGYTLTRMASEVRSTLATVLTADLPTLVEFAVEQDTWLPAA